jgi:hypothetical protein
LAEIIESNSELESSLGQGYIIKPDIIITREPEMDEDINSIKYLVDDSIAKYTDLRLENNSSLILHASISQKWTIRSDRAQNSRSEALNLIRNRKGKTPHIAVVTAEPSPGRISSIALGTGDIDCVYHLALPELRESIAASRNDEAIESLEILIEGNRIKDISDMPLDLAI